MTIGIFSMLLGVFGVPVALLWGGHKLRRRSREWYYVWWGALAGHAIALVIGLIAAMMPPEEWASGDRVRGLLGLWSFLLFPVAGALLGWVRSRTRVR
jgi:hypothetical protein